MRKDKNSCSLTFKAPGEESIEKINQNMKICFGDGHTHTFMHNFLEKMRFGISRGNSLDFHSNFLFVWRRSSKNTKNGGLTTWMLYFLSGMLRLVTIQA